MTDTGVSNKSYTDYCKLFTKTLKASINIYKGPCSAKEFDTIINSFVDTLYNKEPQQEHPFISKQDAYNFAYSVIFMITSTTNNTYVDFKQIVSYIKLPEDFLHDMYDHIINRKNILKNTIVQNSNVNNVVNQSSTEFEVIKNTNPEIGNVDNQSKCSNAQIETVINEESKNYCSIM